MTDAPRSAYDLLTKPTLELTDAEVELIVIDLRRRREAYVKSGIKDNVKAPTPAATPAEKKSNTAAIAAALNLDLDL